MKLYELTGVHAQREKDMLQLLADISGEGSKFQKVGRGANAQVLSHSNGMIYKFWAKDSAYESFINYVEKNQNDKHLPKLKSKVKELHSFFKKPKDFPDKIKYVKLEKLTPVEYRDLMPGAKQLRIVDILETIYVELSDDNENQIYMSARIQEGKSLSDETLAVIDSLVETFKGMMKGIQGFDKHQADLHSGNVMRRGNEIVIIDPLANDEDMDFNEKLFKELKKLNKESRGIKDDDE